MENKKWWLLPAVLSGVSLVILVTFIILLTKNNIHYRIHVHGSHPHPRWFP